MTVRASVLWKINIHIAKKRPEKVVKRSFIKEHSFPYRLYVQFDWFEEQCMVPVNKEQRCVLTKSIPMMKFNYEVKQKRFKKIAWILSHHLHLQWKFKLLVGKFTWGNKAKHCWMMSKNFLFQKFVGNAQ